MNEINANEKQRELNKKVKRFGSLMSGQVPSAVDRRSKVEKLQELADELDADSGGTEYNDLLQQYKDILA